MLMDSPIIDREDIERLEEAENVLSSTDTDAFKKTIAVLWQLVLDVICTSLSVRIRAAALLTRAQNNSNRQEISLSSIRNVRSVISTSIQVLTELSPHLDAESDLIQYWFLFLSTTIIHLDPAMVYISSDSDSDSNVWTLTFSIVWRLLLSGHVSSSPDPPRREPLWNMQQSGR